MSVSKRSRMLRRLKAVGRALLFGMVVAALLAGCNPQGAAPAGQTTPWPNPDWAVSTPKEQGMDAGLLEQMQAQIRDQKLGLHSLLILRHGVIVSETYYAGQRRDQRHELFSVTKSFIATLVGIAIDQGKLTGVDAKVLGLLPDRAAAGERAKQAMRLEDLLTMTSGLAWQEGDPAYMALYRSPNWVDWVLELPMAGEPGEDFNYCSGCSHVISAVLQQQTGMRTEAFAAQNLFRPLGIDNYRWEKDAQGIPIGGWGLSLTPRAMARLGYLYLHEGNWAGRQVISAEWVKTATTRHVVTGDRVAGGALDYGYQWWIYPTHNAYAALGRGGQTIFVAPEQDLIVVTTADLPGGHDPIFALIDRFILPAVIE